VGVSVAKAGLEDEAAVIRLWHACELTRPWNNPQADFRKAVAGSTSGVLIARDGEDGAIDASVMVGSDGHRGWVYYLAVDPARRRKGLGRMMMAEAENWLRSLGIERVRLMVRTGNPAEGFYRRLGYEVQQVSTLGKTLDD